MNGVLDRIRAGWEHAAATDAMGNILTRGAAWDPEEFLANGREEIARTLPRLDRLGIGARRQRALDFGCGVGRCTLALADFYNHVDGVDIAGGMIRQAEQLRDTYFPHPERVRYYANPAPHLGLFEAESFDLVYSYLVLQHLPLGNAERYVREFIRVLRRGGVALFEAPDGPDSSHSCGWLSMTGIPRTEVERWLHEENATIADVELLNEPSAWNCYVFTAVKQ